MRIALFNTDDEFLAEAAEPVLTAALRAGLNLPHSCRGGNCGACRARLVSGRVAYPRGRPLGISAAEIDAGYTLLCQARAESDLVIEIREIRPAGESVVKRLPCRAERIEADNEESAVLFLRLPSAEELRFNQGQQVDIIRQDRRRLRLLIVSPPDDYRPLRLRGRGADIAGIASGELLELEGPFDPSYDSAQSIDIAKS
jgi:CDP-4-dehydro-6-deoxyglucose reductase, E3